MNRPKWTTCICGRRVMIRKDGRYSKHSPLKGWRENPWCDRSETLVLLR